jgi:hypothetical protein
MKHWTTKTMLGLIHLTNYVIAPIAKKTKKELCLQFPLVLPYVSLQFFSQSLFEVIKQRQIHHMMSGSHLASQKMVLFISKNICTICHLFGACAHTKCANLTNFQSESLWVSRD